MTQQLKVKVYLEDACTPVNDARIKLIPLDIKDSKKPKDKPQEQISKNGETTFAFPNNTNQFELEISDERFYKKAKNDVVRATNNYNNTNNTISLNLLSKLRLHFNGKELYINNGNKTLDYFLAYSGNALSIEEKEKLKKQYKYENFVNYKDNQNKISYFCLDKGWQKQKDKGAMPEGTYYIDINKSKDDESSGIRMLNQSTISKFIDRERQGKWGKYNIPIYTDKECSNIIESHTQREGFYIHGGESYGDNGGIDLAKENNRLVDKLESLRNQLIHTNPHLKDKPIIIELLVDYAPLCISLDSIGLVRKINRSANQNEHKVILSGNYTKSQEMQEEIFNAQKLQTYWGYKEISQIEEFNFEEVKIDDLTLFKKGQKYHKGENIEIDLVDYEWQHYDKQIIVFGFLDTDISINTKGEKVIENPKWRIITWHNPIVNPRVTLFSSSGKFEVSVGMFGEIKDRTSKKHQGIDFFAQTGTNLYAPLDCEVISTGFSSSYGQTINLKVTESNLEILKIRRAFIDYQLAYEDKGEKTQGEHFDEEAESYYLFYAHLSKVNVKKGDKVVAGEIIGLSGVSGNAKNTKAPHLHFEIRDKIDAGAGLKNRINPAFYIECKKLYSEFSQEERQEQQEVCGKISNNANGICILK